MFSSVKMGPCYLYFGNVYFYLIACHTSLSHINKYTSDHSWRSCGILSYECAMFQFIGSHEWHVAVFFHFPPLTVLRRASSNMWFSLSCPFKAAICTLSSPAAFLAEEPQVVQTTLRWAVHEPDLSCEGWRSWLMTNRWNHFCPTQNYQSASTPEVTETR